MAYSLSRAKLCAFFSGTPGSLSVYNLLRKSYLTGYCTWYTMEG